MVHRRADRASGNTSAVASCNRRKVDFFDENGILLDIHRSFPFAYIVRISGRVSLGHTAGLSHVSFLRDQCPVYTGFEHDTLRACSIIYYSGAGVDRKTTNPPLIAFLMVFPVVSASVKTGLNSVNHELFEVAHVYHFTRLQTIRLLYQPAVLPHLITSARVTLGLAWKASVAAEILCSLSHSIGGNIYTSKLELETDTLFAWTITVILISILFEYLLSRALDALHPTARRNVSNVR